MAAPEIKRDEFLYRDTLFVDLGETKRHARASITELKDLLLPKKGKLPAKDQVAHWYEAQLIHYGLPRTKDKNTAKVRLTTALISDSLAVPAHISQLEADMKKQYVAAVRKAKAAAGSASKASKLAESPATNSKKRKATTSESHTGANSTTISLKIGDVSLEVGIPTASAAGNKKQKTQAAESKKKATATPTSKTKGTADSKAKTTAAPKSKATPKAKAVVKEPASKAKTTVKATTIKPSTTQPGPVVTSPSPMQRAGRPIQTARRGKPFSLSPATRNVPRGSTHSFQHLSSPSDSDLDDDAPPPYESIDFSQDQPPSPSGNSDSDIVQISGVYNVSSPQLDHYHTLALQIDHYTDELWGSFQIGAHSGVIRMTSIEGITEGRPVSFGWRSRNDNTGQLKFGRACNGSMVFDGHEGVHGHFYGFLYGDDLEFVGSLEDDTPGLVDLDDLLEQWDSFPRIAYDRD
ncbi:hypothetical protein ABEF93_007618 [Exophiala dermatitidis]